jgi:hypothetical protein
MHLGCNLCEASPEFRFRNHALHPLHVFDREWLGKLVARHASSNAGANAINFVQEMVGHLDLRVLVRSMRVFLRLRKAETSSARVASS